MKILSLDLSTKSSGWAIFDDGKLISYGCITASSTSLINRIKKITEELTPILKENTIDRIIAEEVRPETNSGNLQTHRALMWLQAAIAFMVYDEKNKCEIEYIYPSSWRAACGIKNGRGIKRSSLKEAGIEFVKETYGIVVNDDIADAIGIGHSFFNKETNEVNWG